MSRRRSSRRPGLIARWLGTRTQWGPNRQQIRNRRRLLFGLLAVSLLAAGIYGGIHYWRTTQLGTLQARADQAFAAGEYEQARDLYLELLDLPVDQRSDKPGPGDNLHALALCYEKLDDPEQLHARMTEFRTWR